MARLRTLLMLTVGLMLTGVIAPSVMAEQAKLDVSISHPVLLDQGKQTAYLKVGLTGFAMKENADRTPVNLSVVLDRSGSMSGEKIARAKDAAIFALDRLGKHDILSIVTYDDSVNVLLPSTKLDDRESVRRMIRAIQPGGSTALYAGVQKGAQELKKFLDKNQVNRVVLLSDGLANVGPDTPQALAELGTTLCKDNISVSTLGLGLGYNEDLMVRLAQSGEGNHYFVENANDLARIFDGEFETAMRVVAQEAEFTVKFAEGVRPVRALNREVDISGQKATFSIPQIYAEHEKFVIFEVEIQSGTNGKQRTIAEVDVSYANLSTKTTDRLQSETSARFSDSKELVESKIDKSVLEASVLLVANLQNQMATKLRDKGDADGAEKLLRSNAKYLESARDRYALPAPAINAAADMNREQSERLDESSWNANRKAMSFGQNAYGSQQIAPTPKK